VHGDEIYERLNVEEREGLPAPTPRTNPAAFDELRKNLADMPAVQEYRSKGRSWRTGIAVFAGSVRQCTRGPIILQ
jgi:hypothetical protein